MTICEYFTRRKMSPLFRQLHDTKKNVLKYYRSIILYYFKSIIEAPSFIVVQFSFTKMLSRMIFARNMHFPRESSSCTIMWRNANVVSFFSPTFEFSSFSSRRKCVLSISKGGLAGLSASAENSCPTIIGRIDYSA